MQYKTLTRLFESDFTDEQKAEIEAEVGMPVPTPIEAGTVLTEWTGPVPDEVAFGRLFGLVPSEVVLVTHPADGDWLLVVLGSDVEVVEEATVGA